MGKQDVARDVKNLEENEETMCNHHVFVLNFNQKNGTLDFETRFGSIFLTLALLRGPCNYDNLTVYA